MTKLKDKVAFITGSAQGIGKAIAAALAKEGANIVISDINLELAAQTAKEIEAMGVKTMAIKTNVADLLDVEKSVAEIVKTFSRIDILVNNAGITKDNLLIRMKNRLLHRSAQAHLLSKFIPAHLPMQKLQVMRKMNCNASSKLQNLQVRKV